MTIDNNLKPVMVVGNVLCCPMCGSDYTRQTNVKVYERAEDAKICTLTSIAEDGTLVVQANNDGDNPSLRRHGLTIQVICESCENNNPNAVYELCVAQHKGETQIYWRISSVTVREQVKND